MLHDANSFAAESRAIEMWQEHPMDYAVPVKVSQERRTFELPPSIWYVMFLSYAVFFVAMIAAVGRDGSALFMVLISAAYAVMYFGTAAALNKVGAAERPATVPGDIDTATGKLSYWAAYAQILTVPLVIAFFGCAIAIVHAAIIYWN
jgi:hypothetical protein